MVTATLAEPRFVAAFDRACSWWAPDVKDPDYALIHEQVHFAITEHAARQLTREFADSARAIRGRGTSRKAAEAQLMQRIRMLANLKQSESSAQHDEFDAATRADRAPESQQVWVRRYQELLGVPYPDPESADQ